MQINSRTERESMQNKAIVQLGDGDFASADTIYKKTGITHGCVRVVLPDGMPSWLAVGQEAVEAVLSSKQLVRNALEVDPAIRPYLSLAGDFPLSEHILFADGDDHSRMKAVLNPSFTRGSVEKLRPWMNDFVDGLIDAFIESGETDFIQTIALPLPIAVISKILGVPEEDQSVFEAKASVITGVGNGQDQSDIQQAGEWFFEFSGKMLDQRMKKPEDDLMSVMAQAVKEGSLTDLEARSNAFLFLSAGYETTVNLLANGLSALLQNKEQLDYAISNKDEESTSLLVEELLRFDSPVSAITYRFAKEATSICGANIAPGEHVAIALPTANYDEKIFTCPAHLDTTRSPNPHMSFGKSIHFCIGAP